jgi:hypothetical protein
MSPLKLRRWSWIHKWSSLVCTVFMLLLCLTGLPLIYRHEIGQLLGNEVAAPALAPDLAGRRASLDEIVAAGRARYPDKVMMYMSQEADEPAFWFLTMGAHANDPTFVSIAVDARTARYVAEPPIEGGGFLQLMFHLHVDLFAGVAGKLFLGCMGVLLLVAIVSGAVLYAPFMRKLDFGTVRHGRTARLRWLDLHNLLGIVTLVWAFVVGATGVVNTLADVLLDVWQRTEIAAMVAPYAGMPPASTFSTASMQASVTRAQAALPGMRVGFVAFPQPASLRRLPARRQRADVAPVPPGAARCPHRRHRRPAPPAVVPDGLIVVAAAALRRLRRRRPQARVGIARPRDDRRAGQRTLPVAAARAQGRAHGASGRTAGQGGAGVGARRGRRVSVSTGRIWRVPILLGAATVAGLAAGLLGDGVWDWVSTAALAGPVLVALRYAFRPRV